MKTYRATRRRGALDANYEKEERESNISYEGEESDSPNMNKYHRGLLQVLMANGATKTEQLKKYLQNRGKNPDNLEQYIDVINGNIRPFHMRISALSFNRVRYHVLCNEMEDELSKFATTWSQHEIDLYRNILRAIIENDIKPISRSDATSLRNTNMTLNYAEHTIDKFLYESALSEKSNSHLGLGVRCIVELRNYIEHEFGKDVLAGRTRQIRKSAQ